MNKTFTINLAGINFYIDEDAFYKLDAYLEAISDSLHSESRQETMLDIEARIAELLFERGKKNQEVINAKDVEHIISVMGQPEAFQMDDEQNSAQFSYQQGPKKLYRDLDEAMIAGVCAGLAHHIGISILWMRILFVVLFLASASSFALIYALLWALVPVAHTTAEKLSMHGKKINIDNIEKEVREGFGRFKENVENADYSGVKNFGSSIGNFFLAIGKLIAKLIGALFVLIGGVSLIAIFLSLLGLGTFTIADTSWLDYVRAADIGIPFFGAVSLIFLFIGVPLFYLLVLGMRLLIDKTQPLGKPTNRILWGLWTLSFIGIIVLGIRQAPIRAYNTHTTESRSLMLTEGDTLSIQAMSVRDYPHLEGFLNYYLIRSNNKNQKVIVSDHVQLYFEQTQGEASLEIRKSADGKNYASAIETAKKIDYPIEHEDGILKISNFLKTDIENKFKNQAVKTTLYLPENQYFRIDNAFFHFTSNIPYKYKGQLMYFKNGKIHCADCEGENKAKAIKNNQKNDTIAEQLKDSIQI